MADPDTHYWCHECNREVPATLQQDGSVSCNTCTSVFVEIMERDDPRLQTAATQSSTSTTTSAAAAPAPAPAPAMPLPGFFNFGAAGAPAMGNPFGFLQALQASLSPTAQTQSSPSAQQQHQNSQTPPPFMMFGPPHQHFHVAHPSLQPGQPAQPAPQAQPHFHHVHMHAVPHHHHHHHHHVHANAQPVPPPTAQPSVDPSAAASGPAVASTNLPQGQAPPAVAQPSGQPSGQPAVNPAQPLWMPFFPPQVQQMMQAMMNGAQLPQGVFHFPGAQGPAPGVVQGDYAFGDIQHIINRLMQQDAGRFGAPPTAEEKLKALDEMTLDSDTLQHFTSSCGVCQDDFVEGDKLFLLPCAHYFHVDCCRPWLTEHCTCPICRYNLNTGRIEPDKPRGRR